MTSNKGVPAFPRYGDIYDVSLDPLTGSEIGKVRPSLVVSNDINNEYSNTVTVIPLTSQPSRKIYPFEVLVNKGTGGLTSDSRIKADQIRTVDKRRLLKFRGSIPDNIFPKIEQAIKIHLNMK